MGLIELAIEFGSSKEEGLMDVDCSYQGITSSMNLVDLVRILLDGHYLSSQKEQRGYGRPEKLRERGWNVPPGDHEETTGLEAQLELGNHGKQG